MKVNLAQWSGVHIPSTTHSCSLCAYFSPGSGLKFFISSPFTKKEMPIKQNHCDLKNDQRCLFSEIIAKPQKISSRAETTQK